MTDSVRAKLVTIVDQVQRAHSWEMEYFNYLIFAFIILCMLIVHIAKWPFFQKALSDGDLPSSKRIGGYWLIIAVVLCEIYTTLRTQKLETAHLYAMLFTIGVLWGLITAAQMLDAYRGRSGANPPASQPPAPTIQQNVIVEQPPA